MTDFDWVTHSICKSTWNRSHKQDLGWQCSTGIFFLLHIKPELGHLVKIIFCFLSMLFTIKELLQLNSSSRRCSAFSIPAGTRIGSPSYHHSLILGSNTVSHFSIPSQFTHIQVSSHVAPRVGITSTVEISTSCRCPVLRTRRVWGTSSVPYPSGACLQWFRCTPRTGAQTRVWQSQKQPPTPVQMTGFDSKHFLLKGCFSS